MKTVGLNFLNLSVNAYPDNAWRRAFRATNETEAAASDRTQRLGSLSNLGLTTGYGNSLQSGYGYSGTSLGSSYGAPKIDLGGVVLGTLIGIGALLILPKIVSVFQGGYGGNGHYRSKFNYEKMQWDVLINLWNY